MHQKNEAVKLFHQLKLTEFKQWYDADIGIYLAQTVKNSPYLTAMLHDCHDMEQYQAYLTEDIRALRKMSEKYKKPFLFYAKEPSGGQNHFVTGILQNDRLFLFNPLGITDKDNTYRALAGLKNAGVIKEIFLSSDIVQIKAWEGENLYSCGPIAFEAGTYFIEKMTTEVFHELFNKTEGTTTHDDSGLVYYSASIEKFLPEACAALKHAKSMLEYQDKVLNIRKRHLEEIEKLPTDISINTSAQEEFNQIRILGEAEEILKNPVFPENIEHLENKNSEENNEEKQVLPEDIGKQDADAAERILKKILLPVAENENKKRRISQLHPKQPHSLVIIFNDAHIGKPKYFEKNILALRKLYDINKIPIFFFAQENKEDNLKHPYYIAGIFFNKDIMIFDSLGIRQKSSFYNTLSELQQFGKIKKVFLSQENILKDKYGNILPEASNPIIFKIIVDFVDKFSNIKITYENFLRTFFKKSPDHNRAAGFPWYLDEHKNDVSCYVHSDSKLKYYKDIICSFFIEDQNTQARSSQVYGRTKPEIKSEFKNIISETVKISKNELNTLSIFPPNIFSQSSSAQEDFNYIYCNMLENPAAALFEKNGLLKASSAYPREIFTYLYQTAADSEYIAVMFSHSKNLKKDILDCKKLYDKTRNAVVFCFEESRIGSGDFIMGILIKDNILLFNPAGIMNNAAYYALLSELKKTGEIQTVFLSNDVIFRVAYKNNFSSYCGPISLAAAMEFIESKFPKYLEDFLEQKLTGNSKAKVHANTSLEYYEISIERFFSPDLLTLKINNEKRLDEKQLSKSSQSAMENMRKAHWEKLKDLPHNVSPKTRIQQQFDYLSQAESSENENNKNKENILLGSYIPQFGLFNKNNHQNNNTSQPVSEKFQI